jgi:hypothetical protein
MIVVDCGHDELAIKIADRGIRFQRLHESLGRRLLGFDPPSFDEIGEGSADRPAYYVFLEAMAVGNTGI